MVSLINNYIDLSGYPTIHRLFTILSISGQICLCNLEAQQIDYFKLSFTNKYYRPSVSASFNQKLWYTKAFVLVSWQCQITRKVLWNCIKNKSWILKFDLCLQHIICLHILAKCIILVLSEWSKKDFNGKKVWPSKVFGALWATNKLACQSLARGCSRTSAGKCWSPRSLATWEGSNRAMSPAQRRKSSWFSKAPREIGNLEHQMIWNTWVLWGSLYTSPPGLRQPSRFVVLPWQKAYCPKAAAPNTRVGNDISGHQINLSQSVQIIQKRMPLDPPTAHA